VLCGPCLAREPPSLVDTWLTRARGRAKREAAWAAVEAIPAHYRVPLGTDRNDDTHDFVRELRALPVTPHIAQHRTGQVTAVDGWTTHYPDSAVSEQKRAYGEEICGWLEDVELLRKTQHCGMARVGWTFTSAAAV